MYYSQGRNEGGHNSLGANSLWERWITAGGQITAGGAEKSQQCHKYFLQYSKFAFKRTQIWPYVPNFDHEGTGLTRGMPNFVMVGWIQQLIPLLYLDSPFNQAPFKSLINFSAFSQWGVRTHFEPCVFDKQIARYNDSQIKILTLSEFSHVLDA